MPARLCPRCHKVYRGKECHCTPKGSRAASELANDRYANAQYKRFKRSVLERAGNRCEAVENGRRCNSKYRVQPHHIIPLEDGGTHVLSNGIALCNHHHYRADQIARRARRLRNKMGG